jgi:hypothetical protein
MHPQALHLQPLASGTSDKPRPEKARSMTSEKNRHVCAEIPLLCPTARLMQVKLQTSANLPGEREANKQPDNSMHKIAGEEQ